MSPGRNNAVKRWTELSMREEELLELKEILREYAEIRNERLALQRARIILNDPEAPICINCEHCTQEGVIFTCTQFQSPEDGRVVGLWGQVYWKRGDKIVRYKDVPHKPEECELYSPLLPRSVLKQLFQRRL